MKTLWQYASNRYSLTGEDGILAEIFERLGIKTGWSVEFGASDGISASNTYALIEDGWKGVDIEEDKPTYKKLEQTAKKFPNQLYSIQAFVEESGQNSLDNLLKTTPIPTDFEVLSIDIDSYDWWIWESLKHYHPKVVVIEINSTFKPGVRHVQTKGGSLGGEPGTGSSFTSMLKLGQSKGYTFVCHTGNMIFVRNDLVDQLKLPRPELDNPDALFRYELVPLTVFGRLRRKFKTLSKTRANN